MKERVRHSEHSVDDQYLSLSKYYRYLHSLPPSLYTSATPVHVCVVCLESAAGEERRCGRRVCGKGGGGTRFESSDSPSNVLCDVCGVGKISVLRLSVLRPPRCLSHAHSVGTSGAHCPAHEYDERIRFLSASSSVSSSHYCRAKASAVKGGCAVDAGRAGRAGCAGRAGIPLPPPQAPPHSLILGIKACSVLEATPACSCPHDMPPAGGRPGGEYQCQKMFRPWHCSAEDLPRRSCL